MLYRYGLVDVKVEVKVAEGDSNSLAKSSNWSRCFVEMINTQSFIHLMSLAAPRTIVKVSFFSSDL